VEITPATAITQQVAPDKNFDKDIVEPLKAAQAERARKEAEEAAERARQAEIARQADLNATAARMGAPGTYANGSYLAGQCVWYVAGRIPVPAFLGNANTWDSGLLAAGWRTGEPRRGAIAQTDAGYWGHVGVVEEVSGDMVLVSDMNYAGPYIVTTRWAPISEFQYFF